jgi:putative component of membrane protein insertase Oxa1/YidC/SpoIIIJ protein YidD
MISTCCAKLKRSGFFAKILLFSALATICVSDSQGMCKGVSSPSTDQNRAVSQAQKSEPGFNMGAWFVSIFREHISPVDGDRCPSLPSCASYSVEAFKKHGFFIGWVMTVDRLIHEGDEGSVSLVVYHNGEAKILDPVENNDFWWFSQDGRNQD